MHSELDSRGTKHETFSHLTILLYQQTHDSVRHAIISFYQQDTIRRLSRKPCDLLQHSTPPPPPLHPRASPWEKCRQKSGDVVIFSPQGRHATSEEQQPNPHRYRHVCAVSHLQQAPAMAAAAAATVATRAGGGRGGEGGVSGEINH